MEKDFKLPTNLHPKARRYMKIWLKSLKDSGIEIKVRYHGIYTLIALTWHEFYNAFDILEKEGQVVRETTARGNRVTKPHPCIKIIYDCKSQIRQLMAELKQTPKSQDARDAQGDLFSLAPELEKFKVVK